MANMKSTKERKSIIFLHPDLGIGGAERLVVDAAIGLQERGNRVTIFTSHCNPSHCFEEARDGRLDVRVRGNSIIPSTIFGRFWIICAILRQLHLILQICLLSNELRDLKPQAFFIDQLSAGIPLLRILCPDVRILFYCHFPDKLLAQRGSVLKSIYRWPIDWLESWSTGCSDRIVVNSKFTRGIFEKVFPRLRNRQPGVVYPCVDTEDLSWHAKEQLWQGKRLFLSINRFERKKDVGLAIRAYAGLAAKERRSSRLVIAGGYDPRNAENSTYHRELMQLVDSLQFKHATARTVPTALAIPEDVDVLFLLSVPTAFKGTLIASADLLIYTPLNEHFGIVPLEAMLARTPVLAANEGGPTETVVEGVTGWLRSTENANAWTKVMRAVLSELSPDQLVQMGDMGRKRVVELFSKGQMATALDSEMEDMRQVQQRPPVINAKLAAGVLGAGVALASVAYLVLQQAS